MAPPRKPRKDLCKSAKYFRDNPKARKKKDSTSKKVNALPGQKAKRRDLGKKNSAADKRGVNRKGKDYDHAVKKYVKSGINRGRKNEGGRKKKK